MADEKTALDTAFAALAAFDWGQNAAALKPIDEAVVACRGDAQQRADAIRTLGVIGNETEVELLKAALAKPDPEAAAARRALVTLQGRGVGKQLADAARYGEPSLRPVFLSILADRRERSILPDLPAVLREGDAAVQLAAARPHRRHSHGRGISVRVGGSRRPGTAGGGLRERGGTGHHRKLRDAHKDEFAKALDRVIAVTKNGELIERANRFKEGKTWERKKT